MTSKSSPYIVGEELTARTLFLSLAEYHGLRPEVTELLRSIGDLRPEHKVRNGLGPMLKEARRRNSITILQVFERSGISRSQLSFYENGQQKNPGIRTIQALAYGYRLSFASVLIATLSDIRARKATRVRKRP